MSKGFGFQRERELFIKALEKRDGNKLRAVFKNLRGEWGTDRAIGWLTDEVLTIISPIHTEFLLVELFGESGYKYVAEKATEAMPGTLIKKGFEPGKDFSLDSDGTLLINKKVDEALLADIPEEFRDVLRG